MNTGESPYYSESSSDFPSKLRSLALGDFRSNNLSDVFLGSSKGAPQSVIGYNNRGDGVFEPNADYVLTQPSGTAATTALGVADLNKDGIDDIVAGNRGSWSSFETTVHPLTVFYGIDSVTFSDGLSLDQGLHYQTLGVAIEDVDGDGYLDIVAARGGERPSNSANQQNKVYLYEQEVGGYSNENTIVFGSGNDASRGVVVADMNNDGKMDIVLSNECESSFIYLQDENGQFPNDDTNYAIAIPNSSNLDIRAIEVADLNHDNLNDIVLGVTCLESNCEPDSGCSSMVLFQVKN